MSLRKIPEVKAFTRPKNYHWETDSEALGRWVDTLAAAAEADETNVISIYDIIGEDFWTGGGFTAKRASAALRSIGNNDVIVKINSPGGDMFEGLAIYNLFREHPAKVSIEVMGLAASAASFIAMAGDDLSMGMGTFLMIHNAWGVVVGNRHDMREAAAVFEEFDSAMSSIYAARTGMSEKEIGKMMDGETFINAADAVSMGFADGTHNQPISTADPDDSTPSNILAKRRIDHALAAQGVTRSDRIRMMKDFTGTHDAAGNDTRDAVEISAGVRQLIETLKT